MPTDQPESDGGLTWDSTTIVVVHADAGGRTGLGYTWTHPAAAALVNNLLSEVITGTSARDIGMAWHGMAWQLMLRAVRNLGRPGLASASRRPAPR